MLGISQVKATDTVNVYLFSGSTCSFCAAEREFLQKIQSDYPYMHVIEYEVWEHPDNAKLHEKVKERLNSSSQGVPFLVIGDKSFTGYDEARETMPVWIDDNALLLPAATVSFNRRKSSSLKMTLGWLSAVNAV